ncbi:nephrocystin-1-like isoform X2 [Convolutriloba macropyga]|uniref:nephrocystin-1-like isoform X2 n=1 Tax=Convolutriloba macropyga TaxID=536237 RepID=UPI003F524BC2
MGKKRVLDDKIKASTAARKKIDNEVRNVERLVKSVNEKNKAKFEESLKKCHDAYPAFKDAKQELGDVEDDNEKDFEKKMTTELELCQKSSEALLKQMEMVRDKDIELSEQSTELIKDLLSDLQGPTGDSEGDKEDEEIDDDEEDEEEESEDETTDQQDAKRAQSKTTAATEKKVEKKEHEEVEEEYEDEEEEEEDDETEYTEIVEAEYTIPTRSSDKQQSSSNSKENQYVAVHSFAPEQDGDLGLVAKEIITILSKRDDGWWTGVNSKGEKGMVPSNLLKAVADTGKAVVSKPSKVADVQESEEGEESAEYESEYEDEEDEEDDEEDGEEYYSEVDEKDESKSEATVSEKQDKEEAEKTSPAKSKLSGWGSLRKQLSKTSESDVIAALGGGPSGFRVSTTSKLLHCDNSEYSYVSALHPQISDSGFQMKDLFWDEKTSTLKPRETKALRTFRLMIAKNVPLPADGVQVLCRYVTICLFDGKSIVSNIMTVKATWAENDPKTWRFTPKTSGLVPTLLEGFGLFRYPNYSVDLGLLVEFNIAYHRTKSGEKGNMSCGHVYLKLCSDYGTSLALGNKLCHPRSVKNEDYEVDLVGGTPYDKDIPLDPATTGEQTAQSTGGGASGGGLRSLISGKKQATLTIKLGELSREEKQLASYLPVSLVMPVSALQFVVFYRQILAQDVLGGKKDKIKKPISSPFVASFPIAMDTPDLIDLLRSEWTELFKTMKRNDKKDPVILRNSFKTLFLQTVYPIMYSYALPKFALNDQEALSERWRLIKELITETKKSALSLLTSSNIQYKPFLIQETACDVINTFAALEAHAS